MALTATRSRRPGPGERKAREDVVATAREMSRLGLSPGRSGNVSCRFGDGLLVTPSGMAYDALEPGDVVYIDALCVPAGRRKASSEWQMHHAIYRARPDRHAIVHCHSMHAVVLACARRAIPSFHYMVAAAGGTEIPCVGYATFGTVELGRLVAAGLEARDACLMANHGQTAIGETLASALELAMTVEMLAEQFYKTSSLGPQLLSPRDMQDALDRFASYGQKAQG